MNNKFDELTKSMAQSVTRRQALKKFGVGLAGMALACFGLANKAAAATLTGYCQVADGRGLNLGWYYTGACMDINGCVTGASADCPAPLTGAAGGWKSGGDGKLKSACGYYYTTSKKCSFAV